MLGEGRSYIFSNPNLATFPGIAIFLTVLGFNLAGDGLRDALDPTLDGSSTSIVRGAVAPSGTLNSVIRRERWGRGESPRRAHQRRRRSQRSRQRAEAAASQAATVGHG